MSTTVNEIYQQVCYVLLEDGGFVLGLYTAQQFLHDLAVVLLDFSQRAALDKMIFTTTANAGVGEYTVPDIVQKPELCFYAGRLIEKTTEAELAQGHHEWRKKQDVPRQWHEDNLPPKRIEVFPKPTVNGVGYTGTPPGRYDDFFPADHNLTIVGPGAPSKTVWTLNDTLDGIPDIFTHYLVFGILEHIFSTEGETRDNQRALYCRTRFEECFAMADAIAREELLEADE